MKDGRFGLDGSGAAEWRAGWPLVVSGAVGMCAQSSGFLSLGTMMTPLVAAMGWTRAQIMSVGLFNALLAFLLAPLVGWLLDRFGARRVALVGWVIYPVALASAGLAGPSIAGWQAAWLAIAATSFFVGPLVWSYAVTHGFRRQRGLALGVVLAGAGLANAVIPLLMVATLTAFGWRWAYFSLAGLVFVVAGGVTWLLFRQPASVSPGADAAIDRGPVGMSLGQAMGSSRFWRLGAAVLLVSGCIGALNIHLQPMLIDGGATLLGAAALAAGFGPAQIVGRLCGGYLLDRVPGTLLGAALLTLPAASCLLLLAGAGRGPFAILAPIGIGLAAGVELDVIAYLVGRYFGVRHFGKIYSIVLGCFTVGYTTAPLIAARARDLQGSYHAVLVTLAAALVVAALAVATLGRYPDAPPASSI